MMVESRPWLWPPQCCVPAFVHAALVRLGVPCSVPEALPSILGVRVRPDQENPLGLALATDAHPPGIRGADAEREVNQMCLELGLPFRLRRIPFNTIQWDAWEDVLITALNRKAIVGVGVDYHVLMSTEPIRSAQHVLRVDQWRADAVGLFDDSGETVPPHFEIGHEQLRRAVMAISDGLWIIGQGPDLSLPFTLPWINAA
ncbi:hypothetical protein HUW63_31560 [Myxococcus sp. AM001]|nr:hypothetical protein [Myxococcus sp. AM001]